jgi:hypothetical protein
MLRPAWFQGPPLVLRRQTKDCWDSKWENKCSDTWHYLPEGQRDRMTSPARLPESCWAFLESINSLEKSSLRTGGSPLSILFDPHVPLCPLAFETKAVVQITCLRGESTVLRVSGHCCMNLNKPLDLWVLASSSITQEGWIGLVTSLNLDRRALES